MRHVLTAAVAAFVALALLAGSATDARADDWLGSLDDGLKKAKEANKPLLITFSASWCPNCKNLAEKTLTDGTVKELLKSFVLVKIDVEKSDADVQKIKEMTGTDVETIPDTRILTAAGKQVAQQTDFAEPEKYAAFLKDALEKAKKG